jgi:hypothetical protein
MDETGLKIVSSGGLWVKVHFGWLVLSVSTCWCDVALF